MNEKHIPAELVMRFRQAIGMPVMVCKEYLQTADPDLVDRILNAYDLQFDAEAEHNRYLHDPIEDDPKYATAFVEAGKAARREDDEIMGNMRRALEAEGREHLAFWLRHGPHRYWRIKKRILQEQFGIDWKTPEEMNPGSYFD